MFLSLVMSENTNFGAPGPSASNVGAPGQLSPATSPPGQLSQLRRIWSTFVNFRRQLRRSRSTFASHFGAPGQRSQLTSPATSALLVNFASNFGAPGELRQQLRGSWSTFAGNFGAPGQPSPATSVLLVNLRQQLRQDFVICCKCSPKICSFWYPVFSTFRILSSWISRVVCA